MVTYFLKFICEEQLVIKQLKWIMITIIKMKKSDHFWPDETQVRELKELPTQPSKQKSSDHSHNNEGTESSKNPKPQLKPLLKVHSMQNLHLQRPYQKKISDSAYNFLSQTQHKTTDYDHS